ncbi:hypothetical protein V8E36_005932 [Tilletia maclaganii]
MAAQIETHPKQQTQAVEEGAEAAAAAASSLKESKTKNRGKNKLVRPRGKRGGLPKKHTKDEATGKWIKTKIVPKKKTSPSTTTPSHASHISKFHALQKRLASPATSSATERKKLEQELSQLGGLEAYQNASLTGAGLHGESGRWVGKSLLSHAFPSSTPPKNFRLLDVGAIKGTAYDEFADWMSVVSIDLNPRAPNVFQADFLDCAVPVPHAPSLASTSSTTHSNSNALLPHDAVSEGFDAVSLSLVLNFEGDLAKRGEMLLRPHAFLRAAQPQPQPPEKPETATQGGYLIVILPFPCIDRSRYCTDQHLTSIFTSTGWDVIHRQDSKRLTRWLLREKPGIRSPGQVGCADVWKQWWDGSVYGRKEIRVGAILNNFCIKLAGPRPSESSTRSERESPVASAPPFDISTAERILPPRVQRLLPKKKKLPGPRR